jgi:hypothetical protein
MAFVPLSGWVPDADHTAPGVILDCANLIPTVRGMQAAPSATSPGVDALAAAALGAGLVVNLAGSSTSYAGTTAKLYKAGSTSWTDVTRSSGGDYSASTDTRWRFAQFGDTTIAVQKADRPQFATSSNFADIVLGGTKYAPKSALVETVAGFVMLANCNDTGAGLGTSYGDQANRWWCSGFNDYADWTPSATTQCTTGLLVASPGAITGLKRLGGNIVAYKSTSAYLGVYVEGGAVWQWNLIPGEAGCESNEAIADIGDAHAFIGKSDIYLFDGSRPVSIGDGIREWFFNRLNSAYAYKILSLHDKRNANVWWFYPSGSSTSCNAGIVWNYRSKKWGRCDLSVEAVVQFSQGGLAYSGLSGYTYATLPAITYDSPFWGNGGGSIMSYFDTSHTLQSLTGTATTSSLITSDFGGDQPFTTVRRVRPRYLTAPASASLVPSYRNETGQSLESLSSTAQTAGKFDYLQSARWHRFSLDFVGPMELTGLDVDAVNRGLE